MSWIDWLVSFSDCSPDMDKKPLSLRQSRKRTRTNDHDASENSPEKRTRTDDYEAPENSLEQLSRNAHNDNCFDLNTTSEDLSKYVEGEILPNTEKSTAWALNNFEAWQKARNPK